MTQEFKNRYRALYFGQNVGKTLQNVEKLYKVDTLYMATFQNTGWLQLRSLESITDEEAVVIGNILGYINFVADMGRKFCVSLLVFNAEEEEEQYASRALRAVQELINMGFALPYLGVSVEELVKSGFVELHPHQHPSKATKTIAK